MKSVLTTPLFKDMFVQKKNALKDKLKGILTGDNTYLVSKTLKSMISEKENNHHHQQQTDDHHEDVKQYQLTYPIFQKEIVLKS